MAPALVDLIYTLKDTLQQSLASTDKIEAPTPFENGISLLDVKNELFLSYLQNLVFLIIIKLRHIQSGNTEEEKEADKAVVKKLVDLQVYIDKGVRPLEGRLKYQIDKVLRAADDAKRAEEAAKPRIKAVTKRADSPSDDASGSGSEVESNDEESARVEIDDLQYRPNPAAFVRPADAEDVSYKRGSSKSTGTYKPPRIQATSMPVTTGPREKENKKSQKSAALDEYINTEMSSTPYAEPSIGTTTVSGGRRIKSDKERQSEQERKDYEERNYVRLPKQSKKERQKLGRPKDAGYGGEEWKGLGEGVDRIERLTKRKNAGRLVDESGRPFKRRG
jgi:U3 small nucleolar ribonucleoprotein protein LCP5